MAGRFNIMARKQYRECTASPSTTMYYMESAAKWYVLIRKDSEEYIFRLEIPDAFPTDAVKVTPLTSGDSPICTAGATTILAVTAIITAEIVPRMGTTERNLADFGQIRAAIGAAYAEYSAGWGVNFVLNG